MQLRNKPKDALRKTTVRDVPLLYWTAASWGAAIALSKDNPEMVADQLIVEALIDRAFQLDPDYNSGAIHNFLITYESVRVGAGKDFASRCRRHFERAVELTSQQSASPYVALAEAVSVNNQDREEFESLLKKALAINPDARPEWRLSNIVMQRRARWLLSRENELFVK
jgi:predicted anti-sigma-YlaC factor YlaD